MSTKTTLVECSLLVLLLAGGCGKSPSSSGTGGSSGASGGHTGTGSSTGTGGNSGSGTGGNATSGAGGSSASGTGGATVVQKLCATKTKITTPVFMDFENYDGTVTADKYVTAFGGATPNTGTAYAGIYGFGDESVTPVLGIMAGHPPSNWAVSETAMHAATWGMGGGLWMQCVDASAYKGISFWVRGSSGPGTFSFTINMDVNVLPDATNPAGGGTCPGTADTCKGATKSDIPLTSDWTQVKLLWSDFTPGISGTASVVPDGNNIAGMLWNVPLSFHLDPAVAADAAGPYIGVPADLVIDIDDVSFIP